MIIKKINIKKFGKFNDYAIEIRNGLNIIYGCNEAGKTTLQTFIKSMLYGINSQKKSIRENERKRFIPWGENYASGELYIEDDNNVDYIIKRKFGTSKREDELQVVNLLTGEEMTGEEWQCPGQVLLGIGEEAFEKTLYIRQLGSTVVRDKEDELMKKLINLKQTGDEDISYHKATQKISGTKWSLKNNRHTGKIDLLREEIIRLEEEKVKLQALNDKNIEDQIALNSLLEERYDLKKEINSLEEKRVYINKYKLFKEYEQLKKYKKEIDELSGKIEEIESSLSHGESVVNSDFIEGVNALHNKRNSLLKEKKDIEQRIEETSKEYEKISDTEEDNILSRLTELKGKSDEIKMICKNLNIKLAGTSIAVMAAVLSGVLLNFFYVSYLGLLGLPYIIYLLVGLKNSKRDLLSIQVEIKTLGERAKNKEQQIETLKEMILKNHERNKKDHKEVMEQLENTEIAIRNSFKLIGREDLDFDCLEKEIKLLKEKVNEKDNLENKYNALNKAYQLLISDKSLDAIEKELEGFKLNDFDDDYKFKDLDEDIKKKNEEYINIEKNIKDIENDIKNRFFQKPSLSDVEREIEQKRQELKTYEDVFNAVNTAELILGEAFLELQKSFGPKLNAETGRIFSIITFDKYNDIKVSEDYDIKISSLEKVQVADIDYFSNGTRDQVYFSLRMGIINLIFGNGQRIPLFLDDAFLQYDNYRIKPALEYLYEYSKRNQVVIFTCQKREIEISSKWDISVLNLDVEKS